MISKTTTVRSSFALAAMIAGGLALAAPAYAGACPADKLRPNGSGEKMSAAPAKDVLAWTPVHRYRLAWMRTPNFAMSSGEPDA